MKLLIIVRRNSVGFVAVLVMVCSIFYSGLIKPIAARDIDARYFYVAARCWASGESPYDATRYKAKYRATFNSEPDALFVAYLPTLMPVSYTHQMCIRDSPKATALLQSDARRFGCES